VIYSPRLPRTARTDRSSPPRAAGAAPRTDARTANARAATTRARAAAAAPSIRPSRDDQLGLPGVTARTRGPLTLGIDEAGRGPILGPMVMAAVALDPGAARALTRAGVADSKKFASRPDAQAVRAELAALIRARAPFVATVVVEPGEIDVRVACGELNVLERERAAVLIGAAPPCARIIADGERLFAPMRDAYPSLRAYDHGESRHVAVAAASIIAKDERDRRFAAVCARYHADFGPIAGGGYLNAATRAFLAAYRARFGDLPPEARRSWNATSLAPS
jgi:ribonuclease HII